ncbi:MAG: DUF4422 domain-containing protein [Eubacterium sp.]|nr:DUF4422 domain-containing protein [Eubacterium sp.]
MNDIKLFVTHSPNSRDNCIRSPLFYHVTAGSDFQEGPLPEWMMRDNTGEHISGKNRSYCELTTQYWAWKNMEADYYGFCHYRRYFSFSLKVLPETGAGCLVYPCLNGKTKKILGMEAQNIQNKVQSYDFLIAKGIPVQALYAKNVYEHYKQASQLKVKDLDLFLNILAREYPELCAAAEDYCKGKIFYPCNMFIMKKELFEEYSNMLFRVLSEFERQSDMRLYSKEANRTPGHLGERFLGIYYRYLQQKGGQRLGELQMALIEYTKREEKRKRQENEIPIVFAADNAYVPVLFTCLKSLADHTDPKRNYCIFIFHKDIEAEHMQVFKKELESSNVRLDFVDVTARAAGYRLKAKGHISVETFYRFFILDLLKEYPKVVYLDADLVLRRDPAELYDLDLKDDLLAAAVDPDFSGQCNGANLDTMHYCQEVLHLKHPCWYAQAGVLVINVRQMRRKICVSELLHMAESGNYRYSDQDILNIVCEGRIRRLDMAWNVLASRQERRMDAIRSAPAQVQEAYEQARKNPYIIHYAGSDKPWIDPDGDFAQEFWKTARQTPYYERLLAAIRTKEEKMDFSQKAVGVLRDTAKKVLPQGSRIRQAAGGLYWRMK